MKTNRKGVIGELAVRKSLMEQGYNVYLPEVDNDHVDMIVEHNNGQVKRVQVKTVIKKCTATSISVDTSKYRNSGRVDVIAIYYAPKNIIAYIPYGGESTINLALTTGKNNQRKGRKWFYQYERYPEFS